ncbi:MAG: inositol monophosphatase family protein [Candidatus Omnitrophota bacterium]
MKTPVIASKIKQEAVRTALKAGKILMDRYGKVLEISQKGRHSLNLVTDIDKKSEHYIVQSLLKAFPNHQILAEEGSLSKTTSPYKWLIDPLDGTTNYLHGFPFFSVSIALEMEGEAVFGVVYAPMLRELFVAERGRGATLNGKQIQVSQEADLSRSLLATGFPYDIREAKRNNLDYFAAFAKKVRAIRRAGAASIDLCYVACKRFDGFWELRLQPWDLAAGVLAVEEAGGKVSNFSGKKLNIYHDDTVASNGKIHAALLETIQEVDRQSAT